MHEVTKPTDTHVCVGYVGSVRVQLCTLDTNLQHWEAYYSTQSLTTTQSYSSQCLVLFGGLLPPSQLISVRWHCNSFQQLHWPITAISTW